MARYRKIDPRIWNDEEFRGLSDSAKLLFLFLLTHPHLTPLGAMRATSRGLAEELGWTTEAFREAFREVCRKPLIQVDEKACFWSIPNFLKYNPPENPNVLKSWSAAVDYIPECNLKISMMKEVKAFAEGFGEAFAKALPKGVTECACKPFRETGTGTVTGTVTETGVVTETDIPAPQASPAADEPVNTSGRPKDEAYEFFASEYLERRTVAYRSTKGDWVQLAALRKGLKLEGKDAPDRWQVAVVNYLSSPLTKYTLADLCSRFDVFVLSEVDRYGRPVGFNDVRQANKATARALQEKGFFE